MTASMPCPPTNKHTLLIFDWDDTILPFSFVEKAQANHRNELPQKCRRLFREIERCAEDCLSAAAKHGEVSSSMFPMTRARSLTNSRCPTRSPSSRSQLPLHRRSSSLPTRTKAGSGTPRIAGSPTWCPSCNAAASSRPAPITRGSIPRNPSAGKYETI